MPATTFSVTASEREQPVMLFQAEFLASGSTKLDGSVVWTAILANNVATVDMWAPVHRCTSVNRRRRNTSVPVRGRGDAELNVRTTL